MKAIPLISIIVPVYKVENYLDQCIESLVLQTYQNLEIILIDDGSPDNCSLICDKWKLKDQRIKVIHKANGGLSEARNVGLDLCTGSFISFVDSDDWIDANSYERLINAALDDDSIDIVCAPARRIVNDRSVEVVFKYYEEKKVAGPEVTKKILVDEIGSQVVVGLYKRFCWDNIRFPIGRLYEDLATTYLVFAKTNNVKFLLDPFYNYRMNESSISFTPNALVPYHIYLGMKAHYEYAIENYPDVANICCAKTAHYAISTYYHYCQGHASELQNFIDDVLTFLNNNRDKVFNYNGIPGTRRLALRIYYFSPRLFKFLCIVAWIFKGKK